MTYNFKVAAVHNYDIWTDVSSNHLENTLPQFYFILISFWDNNTLAQTSKKEIHI